MPIFGGTWIHHIPLWLISSLLKLLQYFETQLQYCSNIYNNRRVSSPGRELQRKGIQSWRICPRSVRHQRFLQNRKSTQLPQDSSVCFCRRLPPLWFSPDYFILLVNFVAKSIWSYKVFPLVQFKTFFEKDGLHTKRQKTLKNLSQNKNNQQLDNTLYFANFCDATYRLLFSQV